MVRRIYHKKSSKVPAVLKLIAFVAVCALLWHVGEKVVSYFGFNPQKINENSMFKNTTFHADVKEIITRDGIKAYYLRDTNNPIISISFAFENAGTAYDDKGELGMANMVAALLTDGAGKYDSDAFKTILEQNGIVISFDTDKDDFSGLLKTLTKNQKLAAKMLKLVLSEPRFDSEDIERVKSQFLTALQQQKEYPQSQFGLFVNKSLFGNHAYGHNPIGEASDIRHINAQKLNDFVKHHFTRNKLIVGIVGDISEDDAKRLIDDIFADLPETGMQVFVPEARIDFATRQEAMNFKAVQNMAAFVAPSVKRDNPEFYPLYIANEVFAGQGLNSRLSKAVREDKALTYGVYNYLSLADKAVMMRGGFSSTPENFDEAKKIVTQEWAKMGAEGISEDELDAAKGYLLSSFNLRFADIDNISATLVAMQKENLGKDFLLKRNAYVQAVTLEEVNNAAKKYFDPQNLVWFNLISVQSK